MLALTLLLALQDAEALVASGTKKLEAGQVPAAIEDFTKALALQPESVPALVGRGKCRSKTPDLKGALADLQEAVRLAPRSPDAWFWKGVVREQNKDLAGAVEDYGKSLEAGARNPVVLLRRGTCLNSLNRHEEALPDFDRVIEGGMRTFESHWGRGEARLAAQHFAGASSDFTRVHWLDPGSRTLARRLVGWWGMRAWENALRDLGTLASLKALDPREAAVLQWVLLSRLGREAGPRPHPEPDTVLGELGLGVRRQLDGSFERARTHFEKAARLAPADSALAHLLAAEKASLIREERIRVLDELEARFRKLGPFEAELQVEGGETVPKEFGVSRIRIAVDLPGRFYFYRLQGTTDGLAQEGFGLLEKGRFLVQMPGEPARSSDLGREFDDPEAWEAGFLQELHAILPERPGSAQRNLPHLLLDVEPKTGPDARGTLRFSYGWAAQSASWFRELRAPGTVTWTRDGGGFVFDIPRRKKRIEIDAESGFLRRLRVEDHDGKPRELKLVSVGPLRGRPEVPRPAKTEEMPLSLAQFFASFREHDAGLALFVIKSIQRWDEVTKSGKEAAVRAVVTRTGARLLDSLDRHFARSMSREYVRAELDRGVRADDLLKNREAEAEKFRKIYAEARTKGVGVLRARMAELAWEVETAALEWPVDSRHHGALRSLLKEALPFEALDAERAKNHPDSVDKVFREELEALRQL